MLALGKGSPTSLQFKVSLGGAFLQAAIRGKQAITHRPTKPCETLPSQYHLSTGMSNWSRQADGFVIQGASRIADSHRSAGLPPTKRPEEIGSLPARAGEPA